MYLPRPVYHLQNNDLAAATQSIDAMAEGGAQAVLLSINGSTTQPFQGLKKPLLSWKVLRPQCHLIRNGTVTAAFWLQMVGRMSLPCDRFTEAQTIFYAQVYLA